MDNQSSLSEQERRAAALIERSLERGRLAHSYLLVGSRLEALEATGRRLARTLNCRAPLRRGVNGVGLEACGACTVCKRIDHDAHPDVYWVRPESKTRLIRIEQIRELLQAMHLRATEADFKVAILVAADRMNESAANAFLKTLEEPPAKSVLILLTTDPGGLLETIRSRCLRVSLGGGGGWQREPQHIEWIQRLSEFATASQHGLLGRYRLLGVLLSELARTRERIDRALAGASPLETYQEIEPGLREKWEKELEAAIEAEYRRQREEILATIQWWLRDIWLRTLRLENATYSFPELSASTRAVATRISPTQAVRNLGIMDQTQRLLQSNVQEALALEVGLLKLTF